MKILSTNSKLDKSIKQFGNDVLTAGLFLAPHRRSGYNVCPMAGFCSVVCNLWFSGRTVTSTVRNAMLNRSKLFFDNRKQFEQFLKSDLQFLIRKSVREGKSIFVRLNGSSDLNLSSWAVEYPQVNFYDYTKVSSRIQKVIENDWPNNYSLCYSYSENCDWSIAKKYLKTGGTVAVVFDTEYCPQHKRIGQLPDRFKGFPVIDGDKHDLRHPLFDGSGVIIGLRFKGSRRLLESAINHGFVVKG